MIQGDNCIYFPSRLVQGCSRGYISEQAHFSLSHIFRAGSSMAALVVIVVWIEGGFTL
jgi:hypothetical protein